jgi:hypothetical protein
MRKKATYCAMFRILTFFNFFGAQMALASLVAISRPKQIPIFKTHPFQWLLVMDLARIKIIKSRAI